jgi:hypothetical protein
MKGERTAFLNVVRRVTAQSIVMLTGEKHLIDEHCESARCFTSFNMTLPIIAYIAIL